MTLLPDEYIDVERDYAAWIIPTLQGRVQKRTGLTLTEAREFYDAIAPRVRGAIAYLEQYSIDDLPVQAKNLWYLLAMWIQAALSVEIFDSTTPPFAVDNNRVKIQELPNKHPLL